MAVSGNSAINPPANVKVFDVKVPDIDPTHLEYSPANGLSQDDAEFLRDYPASEHKKVFRKVDWRLMPTLMSLYLIANIDRCVFMLSTNESTILKLFYAGRTWETQKSRVLKEI